MRNAMLIGFTVLLLAGVNLSIFRNESLSANGETVLLELAPVDPRALLMGDYMDLQYAIDGEMNDVVCRSRNPGDDRRAERCPGDGAVVVLPDENRVAHRVLRLDDGAPPAAGEARLRFRMRGSRVRFAPEAFFFQEGHAEAYENARYGEFRVDEKGNKLLVHLVDGDFKRITPERIAEERRDADR